MCRIPFRCMNTAKSLLTKAGPLSITQVSGIPCVAKIWHNLLTVTWPVALVVGMTSNHLECASMTTKKMRFLNGPA